MKKISLSAIPLDTFFEKIEKIGRIQRILFYVGAFVLLIGPFVYFSYLPKLKQINQLSKDLDGLKTQLVTAKRQASQLPEFRKKEKQAQARFSIAKKALPQKKEIPSLLASVSESGQQAGLDFLLFKPNNEKRKQFYAEIPVSIKVTGTYHNVASFFEKVSRLPRLVNINNITLNTTKQKGTILNTTCTAVTYRFIEASKKRPQKKGKKGK